jgi:hypothetical protein
MNDRMLEPMKLPTCILFTSLSNGFDEANDAMYIAGGRLSHTKGYCLPTTGNAATHKQLQIFEKYAFYSTLRV